MSTVHIPDWVYEKAVSDCTTAEEFLGKYCIPKRFTERGIDYVIDVIRSAHKDISLIGYTTISKHDNTTGQMIHFVPPANPSAPLLDTWEQIARGNHFIKRNYPGLFSKNMLHECTSPIQMHERFKKGDFVVGQGLYYANICFINYSTGSPEWMVIRDDLGFEILFMGDLQDDIFLYMLYRMLNATKEQCLNGTY